MLGSLGAIVLGLALAGYGGDALSPEDRAAYESARAAAGRNPDAHVELALWCEARGLETERLRHLSAAIAIDPDHAAARGLLGHVALGGKWVRAHDVSTRVAADAELAAALAEYHAKRAAMADTAESHWKMALWCEAKHLDGEAQAHLARVVVLDPGREPAWKRLGFKKVGGRWVTDAQIAEAKAQAKAQDDANRHWRPRLEKWKADLARPDRRDRAEADLARLDDPRALPAIWAIFASGNESSQQRTVQLLGQIDDPRASRALVLLATGGGSESVRRVAVETLAHRDPREFVPDLIALIREPIRYEVRPVGGPGAPGALFVEGQRVNLQRVYAPPPLPNLPDLTGGQLSYDEFGLPVVGLYAGSYRITTPFAGATFADPNTNPNLAQLRQHPLGAAVIEHAPRPAAPTPPPQVPTGGGRLAVETTIHRTIQIPVGQILARHQAAAMTAQRQLEADVQALDELNAQAASFNDRVLPLLGRITGHEAGADRRAWSSWWLDQQGYAAAPYDSSQPKPTIVQRVPLAHVPEPMVFEESLLTESRLVAQHSCFRKGTLVATLMGPRPIETLQLGDRVLALDPATGRASHQTVRAIFHNPPAALLKLDLGDESIWATGIHRFWKAGSGWTMARELRPGDTVRTLGGTARVRAIEEGPVEPVYNLEVAAGASFLVGSSGVIVHDNSLVLPVTEPFDAPPTLAVSSTKP